MENGYLEYYGKHHISPVNQDITDIKAHFERRRKLYRQCGIPTIAFRNAEILEVGPGGGYNTLAFFHWGSRHIDLVEANPRGIEDMKSLFGYQEIPEDKYGIISCKIEDYSTEKKYDIIIAEGFLSNVPNQQEIIDKLKDLAAPDGIIVVTCIDNVSCFVENMKRLIGKVMVRDILSYQDKLSFLSEIFGKQLAMLKGVSRPTEDWVQDNILNPVINDNLELSMLQAICFFGGYDVLGSSPQMFVDYSWYKDIWYAYKEDYKRQFREKHMGLLLTNMPEQIMAVEKAGRLERHFKCIRNLVSEYDKTLQSNYIEEILIHMNEMEEDLQGIDGKFLDVFAEIRDALWQVHNIGEVNMEEYPHFFSAFGRSQQYIAFMKT
ncbi:MAG: class I SAM-dependent methyltransferase [Lachnospiraceae bacterium]|nr:class I SAM-dependent methyltransferase [Lachnospiraceae bacterium]